MGIFDSLAAAVPGAIAARTGYMAGEEQRDERTRKERLEELALERQSALDRLKASVDSSTIARNNAQAQRYRDMDGGHHWQIVQTDKGVMQVDPDSGETRWVREPGDTSSSDAPEAPKSSGALGALRRGVAGSGTPSGGTSAPSRPIAQPRTPASGLTPRNFTLNGKSVAGFVDKKGHHYDANGQPVTGNITPYVSPTSGSGASSSAQQRLDAKTALDEALRGEPHPSTIPQKITNPAILNAAPGTEIKKLPLQIDNPAYLKAVQDSTNYDQTTVRPLRKHLMDVTVGDKVKIGDASGPTTGATSGAPAPTPAPKAPASRRGALSPETQRKMQAEFNEASAKLQAILANPAAPDGVKAMARDAYNRRQAAIAQKYGVTSEAAQ